MPGGRAPAFGAPGSARPRSARWSRGRSAFVQRFLEQALPPDEDDHHPPYQAAQAVERDEALASEMQDWDVLGADGLATGAASLMDSGELSFI
jgi:hypothetical protein